MGWVENYKSSEGVVVQGYPNSQLKNQPIFLMSESASTGKVIDINFSKDLSPDFRDFIVSVCDQFSPPAKFKSSNYAIANEAMNVIPFFDSTTNSRLLAELPRISENVQVLSLVRDEASVSSDGKVSERIQLDQNKFVRNYASTFAFSLGNVDNFRVAEEATNVQFNGTNFNFKANVQTSLSLIEKVVPSADFISGVRKAFEAGSSLGAVNKADLDGDIQNRFKADVETKASTFTQNPGMEQMRLVDFNIAENMDLEQSILPQLRAATYGQTISMSV